MTCPLTIVMYHYVRDLARSRYPAIKGLSTERFCRQLDYIVRNYVPVSVDDVVGALADPSRSWPENAILLTFDDGFIDHYTNVFPLLDRHRIQGCFYPSALPIFESKVLDVHKIQFILAVVSDVNALLAQVFSFVEEFRSSWDLRAKEEYDLLCGKHRYDSHGVVVLKRLLQRELPYSVRTEIVRRLFSKHVTADEAAFACELYMSIEQIQCMKQYGMHIGSHACSHEWLNRLSVEQQALETDESLRFLRALQDDMGNWTICYPYGGYNESLLGILRERQCRLGFTVEARAADLMRDDPLLLPRIDTNDLPS
jgi:peptidoglycan/xylan/chitin deacetylase (PgdA/CDA1 family)